VKRLFAIFVAVNVVAAVVLLSRTTPAGAPAVKPDFQVKQEAVNPWNHLKFNNASSTFRFAIVTDRTGGVRPGIFEKAVEQLNWMQPEFVVCVGDLITGGTTDLDKINKQWTEFNGFIAKLQMPFFYLPGNHDIGNKVAEKRWQEQFGRTYYHFIYKNTLFLLLNTEDPPGEKLAGKIDDAQVAYAKKVLAENKDVRWTLVIYHRPIWTYKDMAKTGWLPIEEALQGRKYTVLAGHKHNYEMTVRHGMKYIMLGTTGGGSKLRGSPFGEFDHIMWVTMKDGGPVLCNLAMEGILPEDVRLSATEK
jgi:predicted phosphodiesterase